MLSLLCNCTQYCFHLNTPSFFRSFLFSVAHPRIAVHKFYLNRMNELRSTVHTLSYFWLLQRMSHSNIWADKQQSFLELQKLLLFSLHHFHCHIPTSFRAPALTALQSLIGFSSIWIGSSLLSLLDVFMHIFINIHAATWLICLCNNCNRHYTDGKAQDYLDVYRIPYVTCY